MFDTVKHQGNTLDINNNGNLKDRFSQRTKLHTFTPEYPSVLAYHADSDMLKNMCRVHTSSYMQEPMASMLSEGLQHDMGFLQKLSHNFT